jgi:hypothetical protein
MFRKRNSGVTQAADRIIQVSPMGNLGNRMIQYMAALALAARVPGARLSQIHLPEWGIQIAPVPHADLTTETVGTPVVPLARLAAALNDGSLGCVDIRSYAQQIGNLLPAAAYRDRFVTPDLPGAGPDELLCNIRQGDILDGHHPDYVLIPVEFYAELVAQTGLSPVFMGQLDASPYLHALFRRFPDARFLPSRGPVADFAVIRASCNIVPSISTFGWLGAWLSEAARIFLPVLGQLHPLQARGANLLPLDDPRYRFFLFPFHYAVPVARFAAAHAALRGLWRLMPPARLGGLLGAERPGRNRALYLEAFDEAFYLSRYPDIARTIADGHMPSGRHHYEFHGFAEGREPFHLDRAWYCETYPIAAVELGQGDAIDPIDHWLTLGRERGYLRAARALV